MKWWNRQKKAFLICPVRGHSPEETAGVVEVIEKEGWKLHWPHRDTDQNDTTGYRICQDNFRALKNADCIFIVWDGVSQGCLFDIGAAFALNKKIKIIMLPDMTEGKSFQNMIREWEVRGTMED